MMGIGNCGQILGIIIKMKVCVYNYLKALFRCLRWIVFIKYSLLFSWVKQNYAKPNGCKNMSIKHVRLFDIFPKFLFICEKLYQKFQRRRWRIKYIIYNVNTRLKNFHSKKYVMKSTYLNIFNIIYIYNGYPSALSYTVGFIIWQYRIFGAYYFRTIMWW